MADELKKYTKGQMSMGPGGLLRQVTNISLRLGRNVRLKHSLAASPSGFVVGTRECSGTFDVEIPEDGPDREWFAVLEESSVQQSRIQIPRTGIILQVVLNEINATVNLDDAVKLSIAFIGKHTKTIRK